MIVSVIFRTFELLFGFICLYVTLSLIVSEIPVNSDFKQTPNGVPIYILSNGIHTDIVAPIKNNQIDWTTYVSPLETKSQSSQYSWVAFGWGNKGFYLETPTWAELKFSVALNAILGLSETAMHVTFHQSLKENQRCKKVFISDKEYSLLIHNIKKQFLEEKPNRIPNASYGNDDSFYDAKETYSLFKTCNSWANTALKRSGIKACLWTPIDKPILRKH